ncbi:hypothetical protein, partial [Bacteroides heparinolyticus]|uniref:hypothetical protein n=1 Tax=Prevotella heparinolytica TaxID=28113 RepID=UPI00359FE1BE
ERVKQTQTNAGQSPGRLLCFPGGKAVQIYKLFSDCPKLPEGFFRLQELLYQKKIKKYRRIRQGCSIFAIDQPYTTSVSAPYL